MDSSDSSRRNFVLVHGAFHGGWCWRAVSDLLSAAGHRVFAPTCTGLGERAHLLAPCVDHRTFVEDVLGVIEAEELDDIVLVGHSFGGVVISGVAERIRQRIRHLVYLDSIIPQDGQSPFDTLPPDLAAARRRAAVESGGLGIPTPPPSVYGLRPGPDYDWVARRLTPHPLAAYAAPVRLNALPGTGCRCTYILCNDPAYPAVLSSYEWAKAQKGWTILELPTCHDAMIAAPGLLSDLLLRLP